MDIGGHRFFSKSDRVMAFWKQILPVQEETDSPENQSFLENDVSMKRMLVRQRISRILFLRRFFDYPVTLNSNTLKNLGLVRIIRIGFSYMKIRLKPIRQEKSLEDFFINRFGKELYLTFFKDYTEKVWGVPCSQIKPEWGAQRIKGLSVGKTLLHALKSSFRRQQSIEQKKIETSLIEQFFYPKLGPGQMWEETARLIREMGGEIHLNHRVAGLQWQNGQITGAVVVNKISGEKSDAAADYFFSSMPVRDLIQSMGEKVPKPVRHVAAGLIYRDFMTVGLLLTKLKMSDDRQNGRQKNASETLIPDNWIYIQERDVRLGRVQIFNNWSPYMVKNPGTVFIGLEYFCNEGDELWQMPDPEFIQFAAAELEKIGLADSGDVLDAVVIRMPKAYPAYFGSFGSFQTIRNFTDQLSNLFLVGRNGMHRYNNADHSMLTAMIAVDNIINDRMAKDNIWAVNTEEDYHESKKAKI